MARLTENKIILVKRKTRLEELVAKYNTLAQAKFYIEHLQADFSDYLAEDQKYQAAIAEAQNKLETLGRVQVVDRQYISNLIFGENDLVVVVGQDGLVANTLKYLNNQLLIGVNPDPARWDGILLPFQVSDLTLIVQDVFKNNRPVEEVSMAKAVLNDGQVMYAVNDLFIGQTTHVSSRYQLEIAGKREQQSSSGIIVSTGLGSTGWFKSIISGASGIAGSLSGKHLEVRQEAQFKWNNEYLYYSVREPFPSKTSQTDLIFGKITKELPMKILSQMPENGVIFSDGIENDFIQFNSGIEATITVAEKKGHLMV